MIEDGTTSTKRFIVLTHKPAGNVSTIRDPVTGRLAVCVTSQAETPQEAVSSTYGFYHFGALDTAETIAVPGEFVWANGRVVGLQRYDAAGKY